LRLRRFLSKGGWNLIGADTNFSLADVTFTNDLGNSYTWANALSNNKVQAYLSYYDSSSAVASQRKFKYLSTISGMDDTSLRKNKGYWIYMNEAGNLTLPSAGGSLADETYDWDKLRFWNGSEEMNVSNAKNAAWIPSTGAIRFWSVEADEFRWVCNSLLEDPENCLATSLNPWQGYFIYSNYDNMTLIRQN